ncbi:MAG: hypothetical protein SCH98_11995 [Deferrisomatales bacterium]|nr:hypothetical protein [Deferrisomatales bacterium]
MSDRELLDFDIRDAASAAEYYEKHVEGTFDSKWRLLRQSCFSCYMSAAEKFSGLMKAWRRGVEAGRAPGEVCAVLTMNYDMIVSGPVVAAVVMPVFAIESFFRLCAEAVLAESTSSPESWRLAVHGFDKKNFRERIDSALELSGTDAFPKDLSADLNSLVEFRNDFAHDAPVWNLPNGLQARIKHGKVKQHRVEGLASGDRYPVLGTKELALNLDHAKNSMLIHDRLVEHVMEHCGEGFLDTLKSRLNVDKGPYRIQAIGTKIWEQADSVAAYWEEEVIPWFQAVPEAKKLGFMRTHLRRARIKPVA